MYSFDSNTSLACQLLRRSKAHFKAQLLMFQCKICRHKFVVPKSIKHWHGWWYGYLHVLFRMMLAIVKKIILQWNHVCCEQLHKLMIAKIIYWKPRGFFVALTFKYIVLSHPNMNRDNFNTWINASFDVLVKLGHSAILLNVMATAT